MDEEVGKDEKIYDIYKDAINETNLNIKLRKAYVLSFQLEKKHLDKMPDDFSIELEQAWILERVKDLGFNRLVDLRYRVTEGVEGYKYFDFIDNDNVKDVFNYDKEVEEKIVMVESQLLKLFALIVKTLDITVDFEELLR